ncbi:MAG TPA: S53 family peptidase [Casimicrobiaceae bacterium]|nr:S53 family peptidase [Casimicrobiaceae bacterium]
MKKPRATLCALLLALGILPPAIAQNPIRAIAPGIRAKAVDVGELTALAGNTPMSITVALRLRDLAGAESLVKALHTPGDAQYHRFLTADDFAARFAPTDAEVAQVSSALAAYGISTERSTATTLKVTGLPADMERAFSVSLHRYAMSAQGGSAGYSFHAPLSRPVVPAEILPFVSAVAGLDSRPSMRPHRVLGRPTSALREPLQQSSAQGNPPGLLTVKDFAGLYDVNPLYRQGVSGSGRTIGIMSLAAFTPSDAFAYWKAVGLSVKSNRLQIVNVDGGPGAPSDESGSDETTLDVEQAGGVAPAANMIVYLAPNTNQAFVDVFATAIDANKADTLSISWGEWEWASNLDNAPVSDPFSARTVATTQAIHELLLRAAIQGQSVFAAAGDNGAYDANDTFGCLPSTSPSCNEPLSVDYPASDSAITAAGGTTLPGVQEFCLDDACTHIFSINVAHEQVWGWDYLQPLCNALGTPDPVACGIFQVGTGGGVSVFFTEPVYQLLVPGVQRSQPGQTFVYDGQLQFVLPANYPGRNLPDVSFNADPETGYVIYYTSNHVGFNEFTFTGGTSFVAPQLNGVAALLGQYVGGQRLGLLNYPLYLTVLTGKAYNGPSPALHAIKFGDNWFYHGSSGYNPGAGLGTLDVANFANVLRGSF